MMGQILKLISVLVRLFFSFPKWPLPLSQKPTTFDLSKYIFLILKSNYVDMPYLNHYHRRQLFIILFFLFSASRELLSAGVNLRDVTDKLISASPQEHQTEPQANGGLAYQLERLRAKRGLYKK